MAGIDMWKNEKEINKENKEKDKEVNNEQKKNSDYFSEPDEEKSAADISQRDNIKKIEDELLKKNKEVELLTDMLKRRQADFENYKKRVIKDQEENKKLAIKDFALDIININDDFLRAIDSVSNINDEQIKSFIDGISIISKRIEEALKKYGIEEIDSLNKEFDPKFNEAVEIKQSDEVENDMITGVYQKGFKLNDYVIRFAKVMVTRPSSEKGKGGSSGIIDRDDGEKNNCGEEEG
jgi:molecular chaperone GrpE